MTRTRFSTFAYWLLALIFAWGLIGAIVGALDDQYPSHWRFIVWWSALLVSHLARLPIVLLLWLAFLFDAFSVLMSWIYGTQGGLLPFLILPLLILPLTYYLKKSGQYSSKYFSKGVPNG